MRRLPSLLLSTLVLASALLTPTACSFVLESDPAQCREDLDCTAKGPAFAGYLCDKPRNVCVLSSSYCTTNARCIDANGAENFICDKTKNACVNLLSSAECPRLLADKGDLRNDDVVIMGLPWLSANPNAGSIFRPGELAIEMARRDLKAAAGGIPATKPGGTPRPLVWLVCDQPDASIPLRELYRRHLDVLLDQVGVPAMMGALTADIVQDQVVRGAPKGTLIFSNVAQFTSFLNVPGARGLVYSFYPALDAATRAFSAVASFVEKKIRPDLTPADRPIRVLAALQASPVTAKTDSVLKQSLRFNGDKTADENGSNYLTISLGNFGERTTATQVARAVQEVEPFDPDIILCPTVSDCDSFNKAYEAVKPGRAYWITNEVMANTDEYVKSAAQQKKYLAVFPGTIKDSPNLSVIRSTFRINFPDDFAGSPFVNMYYFGFLAGVLASGVTEGPVTGRAMGTILQNQFTKDGQKIEAGLDGYLPAIEAVRAGRKVNMADGLEFDPDGQWKFESMDIVCPAPTGTFQMKTSGLAYKPPTGVIEGTFDCGY